MKPSDGLPTTDVQSAAMLLGSDRPPLLVDVREPGEFATVRAPGAVLVPLSTFLLNVDGLPRDRPLLIMCAVGGRSAAATAHLLASGWRDVTNVAGGIIAWERAGLPVRRGAPDPGEGEFLP